jgi:hypothetical protein
MKPRRNLRKAKPSIDLLFLCSQQKRKDLEGFMCDAEEVGSKKENTGIFTVVTVRHHIFTLLIPVTRKTNFKKTNSTVNTSYKFSTMKFTAAIFLAAISATAAFAPSAVAPRASTSLNVLLPRATGQSPLDAAVIAKYDLLSFPEDKIMAEYVWVDAEGNTRSKTRTLTPDKAEAVANLPKWNFDGSSTGQAPGDDSEVILRPQAIFKDPFRPRSDGLRNILVMCDCYTPAGEPIATNTRAVGE